MNILIIIIINSNWSEQAKKIRCWSKSKLKNRSRWTIKKYEWYKCWWNTKYVYLNNFRKNQRNEIKRKCNRWQIIKKVRVKLTNAQLNKLRSGAKNKTGKILRINKKDLQDEEFPHELFLTITQIIKIWKVIAKNMWTDIKLSKAQLSKMIRSGGFLCNMLGNLDKK